MGLVFKQLIYSHFYWVQMLLGIRCWVGEKMSDVKPTMEELPTVSPILSPAAGKAYLSMPYSSIINPWRGDAWKLHWIGTIESGLAIGVDSADPIWSKYNNMWPRSCVGSFTLQKPPRSDHGLLYTITISLRRIPDMKEDQVSELSTGYMDIGGCLSRGLPSTPRTPHYFRGVNHTRGIDSNPRPQAAQEGHCYSLQAIFIYLPSAIVAGWGMFWFIKAKHRPKQGWIMCACGRNGATNLWMNANIRTRIWGNMNLWSTVTEEGR